MREELDKLLCTRYPHLFKNRYKPMTMTCMCWGFSHGDGWFNIIDQLCGCIDHHINWKRKQRADALKFNRKLKRAILTNDVTLLYEDEYKKSKWHTDHCQEAFDEHKFVTVPETVHRVVVDQVKEKFGTLRFYYHGGDDVVDGMVRMAESMSGVTCENCGVPGTQRGGGWIHTYCDACEAEKEKKYEA